MDYLLIFGVQIDASEEKEPRDKRTVGTCSMGSADDAVSGKKKRCNTMKFIFARDKEEKETRDKRTVGTCWVGSADDAVSGKKKRMVGLGGLEPPTSRLSGVRSNHLSYRPLSVMHPNVGLR